MKKCKRCKGSGIAFVKSNAIDTGKEINHFGFSMPVFTSGEVKTVCSKCFGKGMK